MRFARIALPLLLALQTPLFAAEPDLPKVVLVGDSIRMSYAPLVAKELAGKAIVVSAKANGGDSNNVVKNLAEWVLKEKPTVVHFNCGIHDTKFFEKVSKHQVPPTRYEANLREIIKQVREHTSAKIIFACTTPILTDRALAARKDRDYVLTDKSVQQYNAIARKVMQENKVEINDLHKSIAEPASPQTTEALIGGDGVHLTPSGKELLAKQVAAAILAKLAD